MLSEHALGASLLGHSTVFDSSCLARIERNDLFAALPGAVRNDRTLAKFPDAD